METALAVLLPIVVPYITAGIRALWTTVFNKMPFWMSPFRSLIAGFVVSKLSTVVGVQLPSDLGSITDPTTATLVNTLVIGTGGFWLTSLMDKLVRDYPENQIVKMISAVLLRNVSNPKSVPAAPAP